jgi:Virulence-associated protein E
VADAEIIRKFLNLVIDWPGPQGPGWANYHTFVDNKDPSDTSKKNNHGKPWFVGWAYRDQNEFITRVLWADKQSFLHHSYVGMAQQSTCRAAKEAGKPSRAVRDADKALTLKSVYIDVDVKPNDPNHYPDLATAYAELTAFRQKVNLPEPSVIVETGGGFHAHWASDGVLTVAEWRPYAEGLKTAALREGFKLDPTVTADPARVLRLPETHNFKFNPPYPVQVVHWGPIYGFDAQLSHLKSMAPSTQAPKAAVRTSVIVTGNESHFDAPDAAFAALNPADTSLEDGCGFRGPHLVDPRPVFATSGCPFLRDALAKGGADLNYPLWHLSIASTAFMENGNAFAHEISKGHAAYTKDETQALYERKLSDRADRGIGYPSCAAIAGVGSEHCKTCPHFSKGKSPLNIRPASTNSDPNEKTTEQHGARQPATPEWPDGCNKQGDPVRGYANTLAAIRKLNITCKFETFRQKQYSEGHASPSANGELSDLTVTMLGDQISSTFGFYPGKEFLREAITAECLRNAHNPVTDYFNSLRWDGIRRIDKLLHGYLGADDTPLNDAISRKLMCAIVRRSKRPGCKYDHEVVLQGGQGARKSMFCEDLAVSPDLFTDAGDISGTIKEQMEIAQGKQIIEFAELGGFRQNSRERNKANLSREIDRARLAYGHYAKDQPRTFVPIATTNPGGYLNDPTGERRYWHVAVEAYDREAFLADKDQLYAEAVLREPTERLWLDTPELVASHDAIVATEGTECNGRRLI